MKTTKVVACCILVAMVSGGLGYLAGTGAWDLLAVMGVILGSLGLGVSLMWAIVMLSTK